MRRERSFGQVVCHATLLIHFVILFALAVRAVRREWDAGDCAIYICKVEYWSRRVGKKLCNRTRGVRIALAGTRVHQGV